MSIKGCETPTIESNGLDRQAPRELYLFPYFDYSGNMEFLQLLYIALRGRLATVIGLDLTLTDIHT